MDDGVTRKRPYQSRANVQEQFLALCGALSKRPASGPQDVGGWFLNYFPFESKYRIEEIAPDDSVTLPFGEDLRGAGEMCRAIAMAIESAMERDRWIMQNY